MRPIECRGLAGNESLTFPEGGWCDHSMDAGVICTDNPAKGEAGLICNCFPEQPRVLQLWSGPG